MKSRFLVWQLAWLGVWFLARAGGVHRPLARPLVGAEQEDRRPWLPLHRLTAEGVARQAETGEVWLIGTPPVACLFLTRLPQALYLGKLAVDPQVQGRGLARRLLEVAEGRARALGLPALELQARVELTENHATFRALGFTETGRTAHHGFDRPTAVSFRKTL